MHLESRTGLHPLGESSKLRAFSVSLLVEENLLMDTRLVQSAVLGALLIPFTAAAAANTSPSVNTGTIIGYQVDSNGNVTEFGATGI